MFLTSYLTLMVADLDRSVRFYTETLGLPLKERFGEHWAAVEAPGVLIGLHPGGEDAPAAPRAEAMTLGLLVADLDAALAELSARGVTFGQVTRGQGAASAPFADPDGTPLYLMQRG